MFYSFTLSCIVQINKHYLWYSPCGCFIYLYCIVMLCVCVCETGAFSMGLAARSGPVQIAACDTASFN